MKIGKERITPRAAPMLRLDLEVAPISMAKSSTRNRSTCTQNTKRKPVTNKNRHAGT
jgi:hypothetical protein